VLCVNTDKAMNRCCLYIYY